MTQSTQLRTGDFEVSTRIANGLPKRNGAHDGHKVDRNVHARYCVLPDAKLGQKETVNHVFAGEMNDDLPVANRFVGGRATKLFTDANITLGDTLVKTENVAKDYPGVYSLWLKRVGDGWHLVFNEEPDIWGTQHNPEADVAEIPLTLGTLEVSQDAFLIKLEKEGETSAVLRLAWGTQEWTANLSLAP